MNFIMSQIIGGIGVLFLVYSLQKNNRKKLLKYQVLTSFSFALQYFLLGAFTGAFTFIVNNLRSSTFYYYSKARKKPNVLLLFLFSGLAITMGLTTYKNIFSIIPVISSVITTYGAWQKKAKIFRIAIMTSSFILIFHDLYFGAYAGMLSYAITFTSTLIGFIKYQMPKKNKELKAEEE